MKSENADCDGWREGMLEATAFGGPMKKGRQWRPFGLAEFVNYQNL